MAKKPKKTEPEGGEGASPPAKGGIMGLLRNKLVLGGILLVLLGGGGFGAWKAGFLGGKQEHAAQAVGHGEGHEAEAEPKKKATFVDMPDMTVNLDSGERRQYLRIKIVLEVGEQKVAEQITPLMPRVTDAFQTYLRALRPVDLEGSAGLYRLKEELTRRVNLAIAPAAVDAVLFKEMMVQ